MTPTLGGRIQTRLVLMSSVGLIWTLAIAPLLPRPAGSGVGLAYIVVLLGSIITLLLGIVWEFIYHALQQLRWDKDWPPLFSLASGFIEVWPVWYVLTQVSSLAGNAGFDSAVFALFFAHFSSTWLVTWLVAQGPIRVIQLRWRFEGGSFSKRPPDALVPFVITNVAMVLTIFILWLVWPD